MQQLVWVGLCSVTFFLFTLFHASFPVALRRCQSQKLNRRPSFPTGVTAPPSGSPWDLVTADPDAKANFLSPTLSHRTHSNGRKVEGLYWSLSFPGELIQRDLAQGLLFARRENKPKQMKFGFLSPNTRHRNTTKSAPDSHMLHLGEPLLCALATISVRLSLYFLSLFKNIGTFAI